MFRVTDRYTGPAGRLRFSHVSAGARFTGRTTGLAIKYVRRGEEVYRFGSTDVRLTGGHFLLLPAGVAYAAEHRSQRVRTEGVCIDLPLELSAATELLFRLPFAAPTVGLILPDRYSRDSDPRTELSACAECVVRFAGRVADYDECLRPEGKKLTTRQALLGSLLTARHYLAAHYTRPVALAELARVAGLSPYHLARLFKRCFGRSPLAWQHELRMQRAAAMLAAREEQPLTEIALALGYSDLAAFSRRFRARYGVPPSRWRSN